MLKLLRAGRLDLTNTSTRYALYTDVDVMFVGEDISTCTQVGGRCFEIGWDSCVHVQLGATLWLASNE